MPLKGYRHSEKSKRKMSKSHEGVSLSEEHRSKIGKGHIGILHSEETKREIGLANRQNMLGTHRSEETKIKIRLANTGKYRSPNTKYSMSLAAQAAAEQRWEDPGYRKKFTGANSIHWQGGVSFEPYTPEFNNQLKNRIRARDNYTCQLCGKLEEQNGEKLTVHHVDYNKKHCNEENLIALCRDCNSKVNCNRNYWKTLLVRKMQERGIQSKELAERQLSYFDTNELPTVPEKMLMKGAAWV